MNDQFRPGGDKYESIREDERRAFYDRVDAEKAEIISALKTQVSCWTENQIEDWNTPTLEDFIHEFPEWDHDVMYASISEEIERVKNIVESEKRGRVSGLGKAGIIIRSTFGLR